MKRLFCLPLCLLLCLLLGGCAIKTSAEELYCLPQLPAEYTELQEALKQVSGSGAETASPSSGPNIQPVQMMDLDGDGKEEALAFYRLSEDEKPLKIYIFRQEEQSYVQMAVIEGSGVSINSIAYSDMDQDGYTELIVGWRVSTELQALSVYSLRSGAPEELMTTPYVQYAQTDLNQDGKQEIAVFRADADSGTGAAAYYDWTEGTLNLRQSVTISMTMAELSDKGRVRNGVLAGGEPALYVTGVLSNADSVTVSVTDVLAIRGDTLTNITLSDVTGASREVHRYMNLYPTDIDGDGITEIPVPKELPEMSVDTSSPSYQIDWYRCDLTGEDSWAVSTYHSVEEGWYLKLPEDWLDDLVVTKTQNGAEESVVTFGLGRDQADGPKNFLRIYTITGSGSEYRVRGNRFILIRQARTIFAAEFLGENQEEAAGMTKDDLRSAFNLIAREWLP